MTDQRDPFALIEASDDAVTDRRTAGWAPKGRKPGHRDTRPRHPYRLPSGEVVAIIFDHHDVPAASITFTLANGDIVEAVRVESEAT